MSGFRVRGSGGWDEWVRVRTSDLLKTLDLMCRALNALPGSFSGSLDVLFGQFGI